MGTTTNKLSYLTETKEKLAEKIIDLGGDITDNTTFREYANELQTIYDNADKVSAEGSNIKLQGCNKGKMVLQPKGNTIQNDGASPDNPQTIKNVTGNNKVEIEGKNLFDYSKIVNLALSDVIVENPTYKGYYIPYNKGDILTISRNTIENNKNNRFRACFTYEEPKNNCEFYNETGVKTVYIGSENLLSVTVTSNLDFKYLFIYLSNQSQDAITEEDVKIQIEKKDTATDYEPYIEPIEKELNLISKNLFEIKDFDETITYYGLTLNLKFEKSKLILNGSTVARSYSITSPVKYNGNYVNTLTEVPTFNLKSGTYTLSVQNIKNAPSNAYLIGMRITNGVKQGIRSY